MNVVDQEGVRPAIALSPLRYRVAVDRLDQSAGELLGCEAGHHAEPARYQCVTDAVQQVGLPHPAPTDQYQRVVLLSRLGHDRVSRLHGDPIGGRFYQGIESPERRGPGWRFGPVPRLLQQRFRRGDVAGIAEHRRAREGRRYLFRFGAQRVESEYVGLELAQRLVGLAGQLALEQELESGGAIALAAPAEDRGRHLAAPRLDLLTERGRDLGQEVAELVVREADRRTGGQAGRQARLATISE